MEPITLYLIAALLFVLGLAAAGGAIFGRKRGRRIALGISGLLLWSSALAGCNGHGYGNGNCPAISH